MLSWPCNIALLPGVLAMIAGSDWYIPSGLRRCSRSLRQEDPSDIVHSFSLLGISGSLDVAHASQQIGFLA